MEHGPLKYYWPRWLSITGLSCIGCLGLVCLYWAWFSESVPEGDAWFVVVLGCFFGIMGLLSSTYTFFNGVAYTRKSTMSFDELDSYAKHSNGLLVVYNDFAKIIYFNNEEIFKRGYVKVLTQWNRKKKLLLWRFTTE